MKSVSALAILVVRPLPVAVAVARVDVTSAEGYWIFDGGDVLI